MIRSNKTEHPERRICLTFPNLDSSTSPVLAEWVMPFLDGEEQILVDLHTVQFADTSGIGMLISLIERDTSNLLQLVGINDRLARCLARVPWLLDRLRSPVTGAEVRIA